MNEWHDARDKLPDNGRLCVVLARGQLWFARVDRLNDEWWDEHGHRVFDVVKWREMPKGWIGR